MSDEKACQKDCTKNSCSQNSRTGYIILIVLYILLAIILGSWFL